MMKLTTTNNFLPGRYADDPINEYKRCFTLLKEAGYDGVDISLWGVCREGNWFDRDGWQDICAEIAEMAKEMGLSLYQTHGNTYSGKEWDDPNYPHHEFKMKSTVRTVSATAALGAKWVVLHPMNLPHDPLYSAKKAKEANLKYLAPMIEEAKKTGVGVAVENMVDYKGFRRRYCGGDIYELIDLVDTINDPSVGICIDTGHAHLAGLNVPAAIREVGSRLKCTHINDNHGGPDDEHIFPYFGTLDWTGTCRALKEIGYEGDFSYELVPHKASADHLPAWLKYTVEMGRYLMEL